MSLITKEFDPNINSLEGRLCHWFRFDHLKPEQGIALLMGIEAEEWDLESLANWGSTDANDLRYLQRGVRLLSCHEITHIPKEEEVSASDYWTFGEARLHFGRYAIHHQRLLEYWNSGKHPECTPLSYFVEWGRSKGIAPNWISVATDMGLIPSEDLVSAAKNISTPGKRKQQFEAILAVIAALEYDPLKIPNGGKAKIKTACLTRPLFTDSGFDHAWDAAVFEKLVRMENHDIFSKRE